MKAKRERVKDLICSEYKNIESVFDEKVDRLLFTRDSQKTVKLRILQIW